jgi:hypothetical protein
MLRTPVLSRAGFALSELSMSLLLLGSMVLMAGLATDRGMATLRQYRAEQGAMAGAQRTLQRIVRELEFSGLGGMSPKNSSPLAADNLTYRVCGGYDEDVASAMWSDERILRREYDAGESDDGVDNDGDGLIDEGDLVWIENEGQPEEQRIVLATGVSELLQGETLDGADENGNGLVDEPGLSFTFADEVVTVRLSVMQAGPGGVVLTKTLETSFTVHN